MTKPLLNYCLVTQNLASIIEDSEYDSDRYPDVSNISGQVIFTPNIANGKAYQLFDSEGKTYTVPVSRIQAKIINGKIIHENETGVYLFAAGPGSNPDKITYSVEYRNLRSGDLSFSLSPLKFEAIPGGEVDLTMATPVVGATPVGTTKGDKGDKGDPFLYEDFTPEQIDDLKGPLTLADLTPERLETIKGPQGDRGPGIHSVSVDGSDLVFTVDEDGVVEISRIPLVEAANGIRDELAEDLTASENAVTTAEGYANQSASSASDSASSASDASNYKDISLSAAERAEFAAEETIQQVEGDFATRNYVDGGLGLKAEQKDLESIRSRVDNIEPIEVAQSESTAWAHADESGVRLPLGYTSEGRLDPHARQVWSEDVVGLHEVSYDGQYARVYTTPEGHVLAAILRDGSVEIPRLKATTAAPPTTGGGFARLEKYRHTDGTLAPVMADTTHIAGWGSSSMEGMTSAITGVLSDLPTTYHNFAKGGEWIEHNAARMGAIPALVGPVTIPASGSVTVTVDNVPANANMRPFAGHLSGVHGILSSTSTDFTFTRTTPGDEVTLAAATKFLPDIDPDVLNHTTILQLGKNNFVVPTVVEDVSRISSTMLAYLRPLMPRVLILGHHANANWGTEAYSYMRDRLARVNDNMRALAGDDHFIDVHRIVTGDEIWTRTGITPTAEDLEAQSLGILAPSLRVDGAHFNGATNQALADIIRERIDYLNWY